MRRQKILPFYMTYPLPVYFEEEDAVMRDLEYLQEMYPAAARKYQGKVSEVLDRFDYDGSMIYDEYPDKWAMYHMTQNIMSVIEQEEKRAGEAWSVEKRGWLGEMVQLLLCYEIYQRRRRKRNGYLRF